MTADEPARGLRERKKRRTRLALSQATIRLCLERGWNAVTLDDVAAAAGVSVRTFRNYFANKAEAISASHLERMVRIAEDLAARPVTEPLWEAVAAAARAQLAPPDAVAAGPEEERRWRESVRLLMAEPALHGELAKANAAAEDALARAVALRVGAHPSDVYPRLVAAVIGAGCAVASERALRAEPPPALGSLLDEVFQRIAAGLPAPPVTTP